MRYAGVKNQQIVSVSNHPFSSDHLSIIQIPDGLNSVSANDLITDFQIIDGQFQSRTVRKPANELRIAFVGNWMQACGISTYNQKLFPEIIKHIKDYRLFIEEIDQPINDDKIIKCWKRGESLINLANQIKAFSPDIVFVGHEYGLFPNARYWLSFVSQVSQYRLIVLMHSVFPYHRDKTIIEAAIPEIIVHLEGGKQTLLNDKQVSSKVYVISHGCDSLTNKNHLWNLYKTEHTIIQQGFAFRYKAFDQTIKAVGLLKQKFPDVFFTALLSESPFNKTEHQSYYNELSDLIEKLGLQDNVAMIKGFQSEAVIDSYFRTNKVAVFPYVSEGEHKVFGVSGAARVAFTKNIPVVSSSAPHFSDVPTIKADGPEAIAREVEKLFLDEEVVKKQLERQEKYLVEHSWEKMATKFIDVFEH